MLNLGFTELLVIVVLAIVVIGPERLPATMRFLGRQYGKLMRASDDLRRAFLIEAERADAEKRVEELRRRREEARKRAEEARARAAAEGAAAGPPLARAEGGRPQDAEGEPAAARALADAGLLPDEPAAPALGPEPAEAPAEPPQPAAADPAQANAT